MDRLQKLTSASIECPLEVSAAGTLNKCVIYIYIYKCIEERDREKERYQEKEKEREKKKERERITS